MRKGFLGLIFVITLMLTPILATAQVSVKLKKETQYLKVEAKKFNEELRSLKFKTDGTKKDIAELTQHEKRIIESIPLFKERVIKDFSLKDMELMLQGSLWRIDLDNANLDQQDLENNLKSVDTEFPLRSALYDLNRDLKILEAKISHLKSTKPKIPKFKPLPPAEKF